VITIISPAKTQDFTSIIPAIQATLPGFSDKTQQLLLLCKNLSKNQIKQLMNISDKLAELNYHRYQDFDNLTTRQAIFAYNGDVYDNIDRLSFSEEERDFLQSHMLIISGLYGLLRPLDQIRAYRLEMSTKLPNLNKLSSFWEKDITNYINQILAIQSNKYLINLSSNEYSCAINADELKYPMINIHFKENRNGKLQTIGINAKKARGSMLNFIVKKLIDIPSALQEFSSHNYQYNKIESSDKNWVFIKDNSI